MCVARAFKVGGPGRQFLSYLAGFEFSGRLDADIERWYLSLGELSADGVLINFSACAADL